MVRWPLLTLLLLTTLAYTGVWKTGFVWDDVPLIVQNAALVRGSVWDVFAGDLWADSGAGAVSSGYYRPLVLITFMLDRALFGLDPSGYHLHSLVWHLAATIGLWRLLVDTVGEQGALAGSALFALHPVQSEVVVWISARNDLMAAAFGFAALGQVWRVGATQRRRLWSCFGLTVAAALSKETAFVLPLMAALAFWRQPNRGMRVLPLAAGVVVVLVVRVVVGVGGSVSPAADGWMLLLESSPRLAGLVGASFVSPWPITSARDLSWIAATPPHRVWLGWCFILLVLALWLRTGRRWAVTVGMGWMVLLVGVTWVAIADKGGFGDRFLYWAMAGLGLIFGDLVARHTRWLLPAIALPSMVLIQHKLPDWSTDLSLWSASMRDVASPSNELSMGHALTLKDRHVRAHVSFVGALAGRSIDLEACSGVVGSAMRAGMPRQALRMGLWSERKGCPPSGPRHGWMATAAAMEGHWDLVDDWCHREPADEYGRDVVACAALARRRGDEAAFAELQRRWTGSGPLSDRVDALLDRDPAAVRGE